MIIRGRVVRLRKPSKKELYAEAETEGRFRLFRDSGICSLSAGTLDHLSIRMKNALMESYEIEGRSI
ncbi:MAG: hypothetical protein KAR06_11080 [Deltaproteobacteria bacterium]|nr:hypothetical protein [Deltaproteobacteria bacterium]